MNFVFQQLFERRLEILLADFLMHLALYIFTIAAMGIYIIAVVTDKSQVYELVPVLLFSLVVFVAMRGDFMVHRPAGYVREVESMLPLETNKVGAVIPTWEKWKSERKNTWLMVVMDVVGAGVLFFLLVKSQAALWGKGEYTFVVIMYVLILSAAAFIAKVVKMAPQ